MSVKLKIKDEKAQSAIEYVLTYGWSIFIIAIVVAILYLGLLGGTAAPVNSCVPTPGFLCSFVLLASTGQMNVQFGEEVATMSITALGCSMNSSYPASTSPASISMVSGEQTNLTFDCPLQSDAHIGQRFSGTLWIIYNTRVESGIVSKIGTVSTSVSTADLSSITTVTTPSTTV